MANKLHIISHLGKGKQKHKRQTTARVRMWKKLESYRRVVKQGSQFGKQ